MTSQSLIFELPGELVELIGSPETAAGRAREALIMDLVRDAAISQGKAAELLGISRWEILDLMARYRIQTGPETPEEIEREIETAKQIAERR